MLDLKKAKEYLESHLSRVPSVSQIFIYKDVVVCVRYKFNDIHVIIELDKLNNINLIFRNEYTVEFFSGYFNYSFENKYSLVQDLKRNGHVIFKTTRKPCRDIISLVTIFDEMMVDLPDNVYKLQHNVVAILESIEKQQQDFIYQDMCQSSLSQQLGIIETLEKIKNEKLSVARFGDGEIRCMITRKGCNFQKHDWELAADLMEISKNNDSKLLVCYPSFLVYDSFWRNFWSKYWFLLKPYLKISQIGDAMISRPQAFHLYRDKAVQLWRDILYKKNICFITGSSSRLNITHELFSDVGSIEIVYSKNNDAYSEVNRIILEALKIEGIDIYLIALGPAGTVLSARLSELGFQAIDIGHVTNSYDVVYHNAKKPEQISYKRD